MGIRHDVEQGLEKYEITKIDGQPTDEGGSSINSWKRKTHVTTQLILNVKVTNRDGTPQNSIRWLNGGDIGPPPSNTIMSESISVVDSLF